MSKICTNCGCVMDDHVQICLNCGVSDFRPAGAEEKASSPDAAFRLPTQTDYNTVPPVAEAQPADWQPPQPFPQNPPAQQNPYGYSQPAGQYPPVNFGPVAPAVQAPPVGVRKKSSGKIILIVVIALVVVIGAVIAVVALAGSDSGGSSYGTPAPSSSSPEAPIAAFCRSMETGQASYTLSYLPNVYSADKSDLEDVKENLRNSISSIWTSARTLYGGGFKVSYKIVSSRSVVGDDLDEYKEMLPNVTEARELDVKVIITDADGETDEYDQETFVVIKQGGRWTSLF